MRGRHHRRVLDHQVSRCSELWEIARHGRREQQEDVCNGKNGQNRGTEGLIKACLLNKQTKRNATIVAFNYAKTPEIVSTEDSDWVNTEYDSIGHRYRWHLHRPPATG